VFVIQFHAKHRAGEHGVNGTFHFNVFFLHGTKMAGSG
jgi:hypothetical protein